MLKRKLVEDELLKGSIILIIMIGVYNIFNYVFQMSMAKILGPADYGILAVLMSFVYIFGIPSEAIQTIITRYTSRFNSRKKYGKIKDLLYRSLKKGIIFSVIAFLVFFFLSFWFSAVLKINAWLLIITGLLIFSAFISPIVRGILQGQKKFFGLGANLIIESMIKVIFSVIFVLIGLRVYGAIAGVMIGIIIAFLLGIFFIRKVIKARRKTSKFTGIYLYNLPVIIAMTSIVLIYSIDVIIARIVFSPEEAGIYAFVSLIGKAIFFSSSAIGKAMFPLASEHFSNRIKTDKILKKSLIIISLISGFALIFFLLIPEQIIYVISLGSSQYLPASGILFILGLAFTFASFSYALILYGLSIDRINKSAYFLLFFFIIETGLLVFFGNSLMAFSIILLAVNLLMMLFSIYLIKR